MMRVSPLKHLKTKLVELVPTNSIQQPAKQKTHQTAFYLAKDVTTVMYDVFPHPVGQCPPHSYAVRLVAGGLGHPWPTVTYSVDTHSRVRQVEQTTPVDVTAPHEGLGETALGASVTRAGGNTNS